MDFLTYIQKILPEIIPYFHDMKHCEQDKEYHAEGDVLTHVRMVLDEFEKESILFTEQQQKILRYAITLHDIGKPYCSKEENGHIRSHGHSRIGYHIALELLDKIEQKNIITFEDKLQIANLILYHGEPPWIIDKTNKDQEYDIIKMSLDCNLFLLHKLAIYDTLGRIASDTESMIEKINWFGLYAEELGCYYNSYQFKNEYTKFNYIVKKTYYHTDEAFNDTKSKVYLMSGLPGSGKDTYIKTHLKDIPVISLDEIRIKLKIKPDKPQGHVIQAAKEIAKGYLREGKSFIWNATNTSKLTRESLISLFTLYNAYINIIYINTTFNKVLDQNLSREEMVPEKVINKLFRGIDIPKHIEAHNVTYITNNF